MSTSSDRSAVCVRMLPRALLEARAASSLVRSVLSTSGGRRETSEVGRDAMCKRLQRGSLHLTRSTLIKVTLSIVF
eukprot:6198269-Pleurochrysis_carterae.AAC.4